MLVSCDSSLDTVFYDARALFGSSPFGFAAGLFGGSDMYFTVFYMSPRFVFVGIG